MTRSVAAEPLRMRADALAETRSPVGLLVLRGQDNLKPWLDVETMTWLGAGTSGTTAASTTSSNPTVTSDVVTMVIRARDHATGSELRLGRMVVSMGAVRPTHIDGVRGLARVFGGTTLEAFGGFPVVRGFDYRAFQATAGGRLGQAIGDKAAFGASYAIRTQRAQRDDEEVGADLTLTPKPWLTSAARASFDLLSRGPTDALASVSLQNKTMRGEVFSTYRSPSRLLPSTSLFSVLGNYSATTSGGTFRWRAAPRLELLATGSVQVRDVDVGGQGVVRSTLALDDDWAGTLGVELRRVDFGGARWVGARTILSVPVHHVFRVSSELELVRPDSPGERPAVWPWALLSASWLSTSGWEVAAGLEGSSGPIDRRPAVHALVRISYAYERNLR